ncbi:Hypothetical_protein [Hexamita inflata]|uniref:Hypothetical_protein n=1 Tax=Hexamita inflata TaxID=28002 RepID=A0AA86PUJ4_9EUKA|nr:Hypothetical protein HINF_LOCUS32726 [Hexamita inflata]
MINQLVHHQPITLSHLKTSFQIKEQQNISNIQLLIAGTAGTTWSFRWITTSPSIFLQFHCRAKFRPRFWYTWSTTTRPGSKSQQSRRLLLAARPSTDSKQEHLTLKASSSTTPPQMWTPPTRT